MTDIKKPMFNVFEHKQSLNNNTDESENWSLDDTTAETFGDLSFDSSDFDFADDILETTTQELIPNKSAKETLIDFIKTSSFDAPYTINHNGTYESAEKFIQRMRVELSRFRAQIIKLNKPLNHFYVLTQSIVVESETKCVITLIKSKERKKSKKNEEAILDVLDFLTK